MTIREVSKEVVVPFTRTTVEGKQVLDGAVELMRKEYNLDKDIGRRSIGVKVLVKIHAELFAE